MGVPVEIAGLNQFIEEIPDGSLVSIEGGVDHPKAVLAMSLIYSALEQGREIVYVGPEICHGLLEQLPTWAGISEKMAHAIKGLDLGMLRECLPLKPLVIVDSLSYLVHQKDIADVRRTMEAVRQDVRSSGAIVVQLIEDDLLSTEMKAVTGFLSDGIIRFLIRDVPDGVTRFIRIEKWMSGSSYERNIYYNYLEGEINVDLRYRVV